MTCERMGTQLIAYLDDHTDGAERREVEKHLETCAECRSRAAEFRRVWNLLDEAPAVEPSPYFDARLRQRLAAEPRPSAWLAWLPQPRLALATAALLVMGIWVSVLKPAADLPPQGNLQTQGQTEEEFRMIKDLRVLENYEVLADFDALSEIPKD
jgi:anti-sigma factor RsiW